MSELTICFLMNLISATGACIMYAMLVSLRTENASLKSTMHDQSSTIVFLKAENTTLANRVGIKADWSQTADTQLNLARSLAESIIEAVDAVEPLPK